MAKEKILVVDDEEDILELLKFKLSKEGYQVMCAASGEEALRCVRSETPDLIVLDLMLPGMDGIEVARELKNDFHTKNIPIVMLTAKGRQSCAEGKKGPRIKPGLSRSTTSLSTRAAAR